jgi:gustatory receptor
MLKRDIQYLDLIYKCCNVLAVSPSYNFEKNVIIYPLMCKIYGFVLVSFLILSGTLSAYEIMQIYLSHKKKVTTYFIVEIFNSCCLIAETAAMILSSSLLNQENWLKMNRNLQLFDNKLATKNVQSRTLLKNAYCRFFTIFLLYLIFNFYVNYTIYKLSPVVLLTTAYWLHLICNLCEFYMCFLIYNIMVALRHRYEDLNQLLQFHVLPENPTSHIREISDLWMILHDTVTYCNRIFGWPLIFFSGRAVLQLLQSLEVTVIILNKNFTVPEKDQTRRLALTNFIIFAYIWVS